MILIIANICLFIYQNDHPIIITQVQKVTIKQGTEKLRALASESKIYEDTVVMKHDSLTEDSETSLKNTQSQTEANHNNEYQNQEAELAVEKTAQYLNELTDKKYFLFNSQRTIPQEIVKSCADNGLECFSESDTFKVTDVPAYNADLDYQASLVDSEQKRLKSEFENISKNLPDNEYYDQKVAFDSQMNKLTEYIQEIKNQKVNTWNGAEGCYSEQPCLIPHDVFPQN